jgi:hypothetical protein
MMKAAIDEKASSALKTGRPPSRSVSIPIGKRASDPRRTGMATSSAVCDAVRW